MIEATDSAGPEAGASLVRGALTIIAVGAALGIGFNAIGLRSQSWGLAWIAEDPLAALPTVDEPEPLPVRGGYDGLSDPMAVGASETELPEIPDLDRPVQIRLTAARSLFDASAALFVDAREPGEYAAGRIPGAVNLPYEEISSEPERLAALDAGGRPIIVYCGGGACEISLDLAWEMIHAGKRRVAVYMGGFPEWAEAGYPVEPGHPAGS
jgi:rhodanese-related sulfurtransferase